MTAWLRRKEFGIAEIEVATGLHTQRATEDGNQ